MTTTDEKQELQKLLEVSKAQLAEAERSAVEANKKSRLVVSVLGLILATALGAWALRHASGLMPAAPPGMKDALSVEYVRIYLSATALFVGIAFAAIGLALFAIGASGTFKSTPATPAATDSSGKSKPASALAAVPAIEATAPGIVALICATVIIYFALSIAAAAPVLSTASDAGPSADAGPSPADASPSPDAGARDSGAPE